MRHVLDEQTLTEESFLTLVTEVEQIVNARPLVAAFDDPDDLRALTPSDLLVVKPTEGLPPGLFVPMDLRLRKRWRQVQCMADMFWKRYLREYLPTLNRRQKWTTPHRDVKEGDLILLHEMNVPRSKYPLGRVVKVKVSSDGHI